ncbi:MAG TPA: PAS domain S-box protein [Mucilaginibacter sp.]
MNANLEKIVEERSDAFKKSEERYYSLIEHASDAIYVLDPERNFNHVNDSLCKMTGYSREELLRLNITDLIDPEQLKTDPLPANQLEAVVRERRFKHKNGRLFTVEVNVKGFADNFILVIARDITDRKKMETGLKEAELKFRTIAEKSMVGVYIVQSGKFTYVNPRFAEVFGYEPEDLINTVVVESIIHESYSKLLTENVRRRMAGEVESINYEALGKKKDGTPNWVEFYGSGAIIGNEPTIIGSMIDINERKKAEEELKSSEHKYKLLFESNPSPMWMIARDDMSIIAYNDAAAKLYGYTHDELLNKSATLLRPIEDLEKQRERYKRDMDDSDLSIVRHLKKDGTIIYMQIIAHDIIFEGRSVRLSLANDITEKLKAEESLRKSEANLQTILNTTNTAYLLFDLDLKVLAFNRSAIQLVTDQYKHVPEKGDCLSKYFPEDQFPQFFKFAEEALSGHVINHELNYKQADGGIFWYFVRLFPIINDNKEILGMMMSLYDITERKTAEQDLKSAYSRIQSHVESIKDMAWKQSHLIRSPLANIKGLFNLLKDNPYDNEVFTHIQDELDRMDTIIIEMAEDASDHTIAHN